MDPLFPYAYICILQSVFHVANSADGTIGEGAYGFLGYIRNNVILQRIGYDDRKEEVERYKSDF